ncbi:MAG: hypothetical protein ACI8Z1_001511, partial [Candidatus Azotimanducaceae bacterium]
FTDQLRRQLSYAKLIRCYPIPQTLDQYLNLMH